MRTRRGWLVDVLLDTGQSLQSVTFNRYDEAVVCYLDLSNRLMVDSLMIVAIHTGEVKRSDLGQGFALRTVLSTAAGGPAESGRWGRRRATSGGR